ncbi:MAG: hypothetical protein ACKO2V_17915, partial [Snowella sp.]
ARLKYQGTDSTLLIDFQEDIALMRLAFEQEYQLRYGFIQPHKNLIIDSLSVEMIQPIAIPEELIISRSSQGVPHAIAEVKIFTKTNGMTRLFTKERTYDPMIKLLALQ